MAPTTQDELAATYPKLGFGWDTFNKEECSKVVSPKLSASDRIQSLVTYYCQSSEEIAQNLDIEGSLTASYGPASVEAKASFMRDVSSTTNAITILVVAKVTMEVNVDSAVVDGSIKSTKDLLKQGGDSYISWAEVGSELFIAYQFVASTTDERSKIDASVKANWDGLSFSGGVDFKTSLQNVQSSSSTSAKYHFQSIGVQEKAPGEDEIIKYAHEFVGKDLTFPEILQFKTFPYSRASQCPTDFGNVDKWLQAYHARQPGWGYPFSLASMDILSQTLQHRIRPVKTLYDFYQQGAADKKLDGNMGKLQTLHDKIQTWKSGFDITAEPTKPALVTDCFELPTANFDLNASAYSGRSPNSSTTDWSDVGDKQMIHRLIYPKAFTIGFNVTIDILTTEYAFRNPADPTNESAEAAMTIIHGSEAGAKSFNPNVTFNPGEIGYVGVWTWASSEHGIAGFEVYTVSGTKWQWLAQGGGDYSHDWKQPGELKTFVGWSGRDGGLLGGFPSFNQRGLFGLAPVWVQFKPATWTPVPPDAS